VVLCRTTKGGAADCSLATGVIHAVAVVIVAGWLVQEDMADDHREVVEHVDVCVTTTLAHSMYNTTNAQRASGHSIGSKIVSPAGTGSSWRTRGAAQQHKVEANVEH